MIFNKTIFLKRYLVALFLILFLFTDLRSEEGLTEVKTELQKITADLKTLEKAFYKTSEMQTKKLSHLLAQCKEKLHPGDS